MKKVLFTLGSFVFAAVSLVAIPQAIVFDWDCVLGQPSRSVIRGFLSQTFQFFPGETGKQQGIDAIIFESSEHVRRELHQRGLLRSKP